MDIHKIYLYALQREREGKRFFEQNAARLSHASAVEAFKRLAAEEQKHIEFIELQLRLLGQGLPPSAEAAPTLEAADFFMQRSESEFIEQTATEAMVADLPVLRMAYLIERDFVEFYELAAGQTSGDAQMTLELLAHWERGHERFFRQLHDRAFEQYAQMPWGG